MDAAPDHFVLDDGSERWELDGKLHREDGPALILPEGDKCWYWHGKLHREGGPAVEMAHGTKKYYRHGTLHREDGPAIDTGDPKTSRWHIDGMALTAEQVEAQLHKIEAEKLRQAFKDGAPAAVTPMKPIRFGHS